MGPSELKTCKVKEVALVQTGPFGSQLHNSDYVETGTPIITVEHLGKRRLLRDSMPLVCEEDRVRLKKYSLIEGDLVFSRVGSVDRCSLVNKDENGWLFSGRCLRVRPYTGCLYPKYLYYYFCLESMKEYIRSIAVGATMPSINTKILSEVKITFPQILAQKRIAETLSCLDDKIELNNRINKTLEEMAQAIFKSWFVDFEPFQDGEFEDSELGRIPKGWRVGSLGEYVKSIDNRGKTPPLAENTTEYPIIDVKALSGLSRIINYDNCTKYVEKETYDNWFRSGHPQPLDILISTVGSLAEMKLFLGSRGCIAQNVVGFRCKNISPLYMYQYLQFIKQDLISYNIGSVQPSIKVTHIIKQKILIPDDDSLKSLDNILEGITEEIFLNFKENQTLAIIRDALLPKLMSGEIRVPIEEGTIDGK